MNPLDPEIAQALQEQAQLHEPEEDDPNLMFAFFLYNTIGTLKAFKDMPLADGQGNPILNPALNEFNVAISMLERITDIFGLELRPKEQSENDMLGSLDNFLAADDPARPKLEIPK